MSGLKDKIKNLISTQGPLTVNQYMALALGDPQFGYYKTADPFGRLGDFVTAPEISQLFGEMVAVWAMGAWEGLGCPPSFVLAEIGPGRGTLMADILRVIAKTMPQMAKAAHVVLIENSPRLSAIQKTTLQDYQGQVSWQEHFSALPDGPLIFIANELFDALPIHQFIVIEGTLKERIVTLDEKRELIFAVAQKAPALNAFGYDGLPEGTIIELSPAREGLMDEISVRLKAGSGQALLIDYGALTPATGDTLQALSKHKNVTVFANPGEDDLTSHVDFAALATVAQKRGCITHSTTQGDFLLTHGLLERAGILGQSKAPAVQEKIRDDVERLAAPKQMGELFKILIVSDKPYPSPVFTKAAD